MPMFVRVSISVSVLRRDVEALPGVMGNFFFDLSQMTSIPEETLSRLNLAAVELMRGVLERDEGRVLDLQFDVSMEGQQVVVALMPLKSCAN